MPSSSKHYTLILVAVLGFVSACKRYDTQDAIAYDLGDPAVDGCGWVIQIGGGNYKPKNLPAEYQQNALVLRVKYRVLDEYANCGFVQSAFPYVDLKDIEVK